MKTIKKITKTVAGSALLVGATLAGAATMGAAQSNGSSGTSLGDYPQPFVDEDGNVDTSIVVGESAKTSDVVGGLNIAASLGNAAFTEKTVSTSGGSFGWSADQGTTLDTRNDALYFGNKLTEVRDTLTNEQLQSLEDTTFQDDSGDETDIENYLYPNNQQIQFGQPQDRNNEDPIQYVSNPSDPDASTHLFQLQANFEDSINFSSSDVQDEEIELFGQTYTVSTDTDDDGKGDLILNGARQQTSISTSDKPQTVTVGGEEVTIDVIGVTGPNTAAISVNGETREESEDDEFTVNGETVRIGDVIQTNSDNSKGTVQFEIGSEQLVLPADGQVEDEDGNDVEGLYSKWGNGNSGNLGSVNTVNLYVGSNSDDHEYVMAGESYAHPMFPDYTFRFGGLNPDTASGNSSGVSQVDYTVSGEDAGAVELTAGGSSASVNFIKDSNTDNDNTNDNSDFSLADDDGDSYVVREGAAVDEDQYVMVDAGDFSHVFEVTNIDRDSTSGIQSGDEATIDLRDTVTGQTVEVDLDATDGDVSGGESGDGFGGSNSDDYYSGTEVIDGQTYSFVLEGEKDKAVESGTEDGETAEITDFRMAYGSGTSESDTDQDGVDSSGALTLDEGDRTTVYPALDTQSRAA
ncbi:MAG: S-layer protein, partial [Candidatus Nanohaloarchaea archaeon]